MQNVKNLLYFAVRRFLPPLVNYYFLGLVGDRLLHEAKNEKAATEAYICAGNIDKLLQIWVQESSLENSKPLQSLQNLVEKISVFRKVVNHQQPLPEAIAKKYR
jgi:hypothetical protein